MARPLRIEFAGAWYHVKNRGLTNQSIFVADRSRHVFLDLVREISYVFKTEVHAYCLLDDSYHLLIRTPKANLGHAMRYLNGIYTQRFNRYEERDGPLFRGRYQATVFDASSYLLLLSRYLHLVPVAAGLVKKPDAYRWSSYREYIGKAQAHDWLHRQSTLSLIGKRAVTSRYAAYVREGVSEHFTQFVESGNTSPILGDHQFKEHLKVYLNDKTNWNEIPQRRFLVDMTPIETIVSYCAQHYGVAAGELLIQRRGKFSEPRSVAMALAKSLGNHRLKAISDYFGITYSAVSSAIARVRKRRSANRDFDRLVRRLEQQFSALTKTPAPEGDAV